MVQVKEKVCLICIDGWGISKEPSPVGDAIRNAETPVMNTFYKEYPFVELEASGYSVGLPDGLMGNSEVGHLNIGAGRIVYQDIVRIEKSIKDNVFKKTENIVKSFERAKNGNGRIHFLGLVSDGGVHSHINHLFKLLEAAKEFGIPEAYVHFFGDGRDTAPRSSATYLEQLEEEIKKIGYGEVSTIVGRYYAMDRDKRWERVKVAVDALIKGEGEKTSDPLKTIHERYAKDETDEFLKPIIIGEKGRITNGDTLFTFNFRSDRMREIVTILSGIEKPINVDLPTDLQLTTMTRYNPQFTFPVAFPPQVMDDVLAETLAKQGVKQCHIAETEKYAHVTFFFNGGVEKQFENEYRDLIPSPKVATYDKDPKMSVYGVADKVSEQIASGNFEFVMCNLAPPDMVGHTGVYEATVEAVSHTDKAIGTIYDACIKHNYILFVTADHGNAEKMIGDTGNPHTAHTTYPVPFVMTSKTHKFKKGKIGALCDVAPTIVQIMGLQQPVAMTGESLLV